MLHPVALAAEICAWRVLFSSRFTEVNTEDTEKSHRDHGGLDRRRKKRTRFLCGSLWSFVSSVLSFSEFIAGHNLAESRTAATKNLSPTTCPLLISPESEKETLHASARSRGTRPAWRW